MEGHNSSTLAIKLIADRCSTMAAGEWLELARQHQASIRAITVPYRQRRLRGLHHPVYDFLFQYYAFSPSKLEQWHPGLGLQLELPDHDCHLSKQLKQDPNYQQINQSNLNSIQVKSPPQQSGFHKRLVQVIQLLERIESRPARFSCYGLHEWAMINTNNLDRRHSSCPLRLDANAIRQVLSNLPLQCSHFDAWRFFVEANKTLNKFTLTPQSRPVFEQSGCVHANMDLYKWCFSFSPWIGSDLLRSCFELALEARILDMRASPYDLTKYHFEPICIETESGRQLYQNEQKRISVLATPLRQALLAQLRSIKQS